MARQTDIHAGLPLLPRVEGFAVVAMADAASRFIFRGTADAAEAMGAAFGVALPVESCRANRQGLRAALWLGPDEWLLLAEPQEQHGIASAIAGRLAGIPHSLVEVSDRSQGLQLDGPGSEDVLCSGCPLDLDIAAFPVDACTRTLFGKAEIVLWRTAPQAFHLDVARSLVPYVVGLLAAAVRDCQALRT